VSGAFGSKKARMHNLFEKSNGKQEASELRLQWASGASGLPFSNKLAFPMPWYYFKIAFGVLLGTP
jgi:hypothetical protein